MANQIVAGSPVEKNGSAVSTPNSKPTSAPKYPGVPVTCNGNQLVALGLSGPAVGRLLDALLERVLDDPSLNTRERLLALARELA